MFWIIFTVFFGWVGVYRFHKREPGIAILYLLTVGGFFIGWIYDIICVVKEYNSLNCQKVEEQNEGADIAVIESKKRKVFLKSKLCVILSVIFFFGGPLALGLGLVTFGDIEVYDEDEGGIKYTTCIICGSSVGRRDYGGRCGSCMKDIHDLMD